MLGGHGMLDNTGELRMGLCGLVIFEDVAHSPAVSAIGEYLANLESGDKCRAVSAYAALVRVLCAENLTLSEYILRRVTDSDNIFVRRYFSDGESACEPLYGQLTYELTLLSNMPEALRDTLAALGGVRFPDIYGDRIDLLSEYMKFLPSAARRGVGLFSRSAIFTCDEAGGIIPVRECAPVALSSLVGYEREREKLIKNTEALLSGKPACDVLLYGDAGTGKSTTVKGIAAEHACDGLRLIEVPKDKLSHIPAILQRIAGEPLKFIIFIDDLSFGSDDMGFCALKTVLEGGAGVSRTNSVIYVTSNHRHLVKETKGDRMGEDINVRDNLQGMMGLSARFGLTVTFLAPDRALYLDIVKSLLEERGIPFTDAEASAAEAYAIRKNGRTPRLARQFANLRASGIDPVK